MFSGSNRNPLELNEDDEINLCDFEFNLNLQTQLNDLETIREFSKRISYKHHHDDPNNSSDHNTIHLCEDDWFMILDFIPFPDFCSFSLVSSSFAEILTFNRRYLVMRGILKDFPSLLKEENITSVESLGALANDRSPSDDSSFSKTIFNDLIYFVMEKKRYAENMWKIIPQEEIMKMDQNLFILPFRGSMIQKTFYHFQDIPQFLRMDKGFILKFFKSYSKAPLFFIFLDRNFINDEEIAKIALSRNGYYIKYIGSPSRELMNIAFQSKKRIDIYGSFDRYRKLFPTLRKSFITMSVMVMTRERYELLEIQSLITDYRKSKDDSFFKTALNLDVEKKTIEFLLLFSYFEKSKEFKDVFMEFYWNRSNNGNFIYVDDLITDLLCSPQDFKEFLSIQLKVPKELNCKTREITISQMLQRILKNNLTFDILLQKNRMKLTTDSIQYLRERLIKQLKVTPLFSRLYFEKHFEKMECNDENEKINFLKEISQSRELNLKMLRYYPKYYEQLSEEFRNDDAFKVIAMNCMKINSKFFDFSNNDILILALSSNLKRSIQYLRKNNISPLTARIKQIFTDENGRIQSKWLTWPNVYRLYNYFLMYHFKYETLFTLDDQLIMMDHISPLENKSICSIHLSTLEEAIFKKFKMKNQFHASSTSAEVVFLLHSYCCTYRDFRAFEMAYEGRFFKLQESNRLLSRILKENPKFIKVFFSIRKINHYSDQKKATHIPFELLKELALENPRIIHFVPRDVQRKLQTKFI